MSNIILKFESCQEVQLLGGLEYHLVVNLADLVEANGVTESWILWNIPLAANVRRPSRNKVTTSILKSIKSGSQVISSPLHIVPFSSKVNHYAKNIVLTFNDDLEHTQGLLDGAHRLLSFIIAYHAGIDLSQSYCSLVLYSGYSEDYLRAKAVALNNSASVDVLSLSNYSGALDQLKPILEGYRVIYFKNQFGSGIAQFPKTDGLCTINHIAKLLLCLDSSYPKSDGTRHPTYITSTGTVVTRSDFQAKIDALLHLAPDVLWLQQELCNIVDAKFRLGQSQTFMVKANDSRRCTKLPTGETLSGVLRKYLFIFPIISSFRPYIAYEKTSVDGRIVHKYTNNLPHKNRLKQHLRQLLSHYSDITKQVKYQTMPDSVINKDSYIWERLYTMVERKLENTDVA